MYMISHTPLMNTVPQVKIPYFYIFIQGPFSTKAYEVDPHQPHLHSLLLDTVVVQVHKKSFDKALNAACQLNWADRRWLRLGGEDGRTDGRTRRARAAAGLLRACRHVPATCPAGMELSSSATEGGRKDRGAVSWSTPQAPRVAGCRQGIPGSEWWNFGCGSE